MRVNVGRGVKVRPAGVSARVTVDIGEMGVGVEVGKAVGIGVGETVARVGATGNGAGGSVGVAGLGDGVASVLQAVGSRARIATMVNVRVRIFPVVQPYDGSKQVIDFGYVRQRHYVRTYAHCQ